MKLVIQIPCFNEEKLITQVVNELPKAIDGIDEIIVLLIDDGSMDGTIQKGLEGGVPYVVKHPYNRGLANAFMTGIETALALGADIIVNTDADNQYPGKYIEELIRPIMENKADIAIGDRQVSHNQHFSVIKRGLEVLGSWVMRKISQVDVVDAASGFRAYSRYAALRIKVYSSYSYTLETLIQAGYEKMRIAHLPINTNAATRESRLHKGILHFIWNQGGTIIRSFVFYRPLKTFLLMSLPFIFSGVVLIGRFMYFYVTNQSGIARHVQSVSIGGTLGVSGLILLMLGLLGDLIRAARKVNDEIVTNLRDKARIQDNDTRFNGYEIIRNKTIE